MKFLLIIAHDATFRPTDELVARIHDWVARMSRSGVRIHGNPLQPPGQAVTIRVREGAVHEAVGPFSAADEQMCAYELVECASEHEALALAAAHPMASVATIEVRPVWEGLAN